MESQFGSANEQGSGVRTMRDQRLIAEAILAGQEYAATEHMLDYIESSKKRAVPAAIAAATGPTSSNAE